MQPLIHGASYFPALARTLADAGKDDHVFFVDWRGDNDQLLTEDGITVAGAFSAVALRGACVKCLLWRSHLDNAGMSSTENRNLSTDLRDDEAEVLLDQRTRPLGSHHQKFVVVRHPDAPETDIAYVGGIDLGHSRRDDARHFGDGQTQPFPSEYGATPAWHDAQVAIHGPAVAEVETVFRERWEDPARLTRLPWHVLSAKLRKSDETAGPLPEQLPDPPEAGSCAVQLLRTYPNRRPGYPFAPDGERSCARGYAKALRRAKRLVYVEDQYMWSAPVAKVFAEALRREPELRVIVVVPLFPDKEGLLSVPPTRLGHAQALEMIEKAGGDRVEVYDVENQRGEPVYVHAKICVVDDVWATVGSDNFNRRSWTHDSELTAAILDDTRDPREPTDPGGLGDSARVFARDLRLELFREHLDREPGDDGDLLDPDDAVTAVAASADRLQAWYDGGQSGPRPPGRLRRHHITHPPRWQRMLFSQPYRWFFDPDERPPSYKIRRAY